MQGSVGQHQYFFCPQFKQPHRT